MSVSSGRPRRRPVYPQLRAFKRPEPDDRIIGFRTKDLVFWRVSSSQYCDEPDRLHRRRLVREPGFVTAALKAVLEKRTRPRRGDRPPPMMRASAETTRPFGVKTMVSLNAINEWTGPGCAAPAASRSAAS